jgi:hypothetical protein
LQAGNLLDAIADPIAAATALIPFALGVGDLLPIADAAANTISEFVSLMP